MMLARSFRKIFGSRNERILKRLKKVVNQINSFESELGKLSDEVLKEKSTYFKEQIKAGVKLDELLPEAFAVVREAAKRTLGMRHFDVQLIGGIVLHNGKISEMSTGEGKTLCATLPAYLNALTGNGVHIITVNDYLAERDSKWMEPVYSALGLTVGSVISGMNREEKQDAYSKDIIYGTNNEFGFDYLRDNMAFAANERMQGKLSFAIVDEVDSILIDEARTPLIISGSAQDSSELYIKINALAKDLLLQEDKDSAGDFSLDEKNKQVFLSEDGHQKVEKLLSEKGLLGEGGSLYDAGNIALVHHIYAALRAQCLFRRDVDYIVKDKEVIIVDEHTGRTMPGRRWSDGLHQATEAKEGVPIQSESQTLASITFQNYFRLYDKLAGMTGTADTEAFEFQQIYGLEVVVIPTNKPNLRKDFPDMIYLTQDEKFAEIIKDIEDCVKSKQPALVGTISIETSEYLSKLLNKRNITHRVLNAKFHQEEAQIIAEAGRPGTITIATNMAGRGTDIVLGGNLEAELANLKAENPDIDEDTLKERREDWLKRHQEVIAAGGLHIIGTERHESRRIDNQLRGRSSRQGDPGSTKFYLSVKDNLMRIFISDKISSLLNRLGLEEGEAITHPWITRAIENAQRKVEGHNFDVRKQLLEFDDVANDQRRVIYQQRDELMETDDISDLIDEVRADVINEVFAEFVPPQSLEEQWNIPGLMNVLEHEFGQKLEIQDWLDKDNALHEELLLERLQQHFNNHLESKETKIGVANMRTLEKTIMLNILDNHWKEHLAIMDYMRQSIHLRGYAQKDPKQEYKREAFSLFKEMLDSMRRNVIATLSMVQVQVDTNVEEVDAKLRDKREPQKLEYKHAQATALDVVKNEQEEQQQGQPQEEHVPFTRDVPKIGRNQVCPCGSGRKYKQCHGKLA